MSEVNWFSAFNSVTPTTCYSLCSATAVPSRKVYFSVIFQSLKKYYKEYAWGKGIACRNNVGFMTVVDKFIKRHKGNTFV